MQPLIPNRYLYQNETLFLFLKKYFLVAPIRDYRIYKIQYQRDKIKFWGNV